MIMPLQPESPFPPLLVERLSAAIGVDPRALDNGRLKWILNARCRKLQLADATSYATYLDQTPAELDVLIDEVVVQETRFFRDPVVFDHIRVAVLELAAQMTGPIRILSAPCGTGQEAWSLAALLAAAGVPPARFSIDALDISLSALETARRGIYPAHALSHVPPQLQQACGLLRATGTGAAQQRHWHIHESLRERVRFERRNLAEPGSLGTEPQYHLILCRNLFIYLAPQARMALAQSLSEALAPGGRLVLGTADRVEELTPLFAPLRPAASFAFIHREAATSAPPRYILGVQPYTPQRRTRAAARPLVPAISAVEPQPAQSAMAGAIEFLQRALEAQQRGELAKAERRCRQALYLAPNLLPALDLLEMLWREHPNLRLRRALRDRILRNRIAAPLAHQETA